jgi:hypothetical protein
MAALQGPSPESFFACTHQVWDPPARTCDGFTEQVEPEHAADEA